MIDSEEKLLIDTLLKSGALTEESLADGLTLQEENGGSIIDALLEKEHISRTDLEI